MVQDQCRTSQEGLVPVPSGWGSQRPTPPRPSLAPPHPRAAAHYAPQVQLQGKSHAAVEHMGGDWLRIFEGEALACTMSSLRAGCTYRARVRASTAAGWGLFCIPIDVTSSADVPDSPDPPSLTSAEAVRVWTRKCGPLCCFF